MNRKLIRPNLADMKGKEREPQPNPRDSNSAAPRRPNIIKTASSVANVSSAAAIADSADGTAASIAKTDGAAQSARRTAPPVETNAELYYYKKQIDSHTPMIIVLTDNEEIEGTIEWYDRSALKVNRKNAPNIMLLKHNIKYMYKAEDRV